MADSDNSRTLPTVTRGSNFHCLAEAYLPTNPELTCPFVAPLEVGNDDLALAIWSEWRAVRQRLIESCLRGQGLEARLSSMADSPLHTSET
ncbi:hypothetical protein [Rhizobium lusitanum]|uniref:hypothetical protein n=1 Tax=Rhizobium lusitanum TaxID=293958 RepID=UPI001574ADC7|nr:hypothetical protein [Rhizobium lusitanum]NTJ11759.1 hypothetical protein [Rhizobium lusitanum]